MKEQPEQISTENNQALAGQVEQIVILRNSRGVEIQESKKPHGHYVAVKAQCHCGMDLIIAPAVFNPDHKKGDPVMICTDHGVHSYRFKDVVPGKQPTA